MKCIFMLRNKCVVIERCLDAKSVNQNIDCTKLINMYISTEFVKSYCAYCIKSIYAKSKKLMAEKEVFVAL
ncbi:MAG: hypothetical protein QXW20_08370 [Ignisphaera sp.]